MEFPWAPPPPPPPPQVGYKLKSARVGVQGTSWSGRWKTCMFCPHTVGQNLVRGNESNSISLLQIPSLCLPGKAWSMGRGKVCGRVVVKCNCTRIKLLDSYCCISCTALVHAWLHSINFLCMNHGGHIQRKNLYLLCHIVVWC